MLKIKPGSLMIDPQLGRDSKNAVLNSSATILEDNKEVGLVFFSIKLFPPYKIDKTNFYAIATDLIRYEDRREAQS